MVAKLFDAYFLQQEKVILIVKGEVGIVVAC